MNKRKDLSNDLVMHVCIHFIKYRLGNETALLQPMYSVVSVSDEQHRSNDSFDSFNAFGKFESNIQPP
jgi:hypothetical protein